MAQTRASDTPKVKGYVAKVNVHQTFTSIQGAAFVFAFSTEDPLDPGETLNVCLGQNSDVCAGGMSNGGSVPTYSRTLTPEYYFGTAPFFDALLDGREPVRFVVPVGSVEITDLTVTILGTP